MPTSTAYTKVKKSLQEHRKVAQQKLADRHKKAWKFLQQAQVPVESLVHKTAHLATTGALAGTLLANSYIAPMPQSQDQPSIVRENEENEKFSPKAKVLHSTLSALLPGIPKKLDPGTAQAVSQRILTQLGINTASKLDGYELNTDYGYMGAEQHLPRFPDDSIYKHDAYQTSGITASRGAFGYFAKSEKTMTSEDVLREKYYVVVQTFLSPGWNQNSTQFKNWIKFRKVLFVNPENGKAVVGVVGDAGPAKWTGKQFGGSPEIVRYLNNDKHRAKTPVLVQFIYDPENKIPLGPVTE